MKLKIIGLIVLIIIVTVVALMYLSNKPITKDKFEETVHNKLEKIVQNESFVDQGLIYIRSGKKNYEAVFSAGLLNNEKIDETMPFHVASVGKTMTATLIGMLVEEGKLNFDTPITTLLNEEVYSDLFIVDGKDYANQVTVWHLLNHTSGVADYFDDPVKSGQTFLEEAFKDPDHLYQPIELVDFTRDNQSAIAEPGSTYHYSDTGYILLGLIIESVTQQSFEAYLQKVILEPLHMDDTYMMFRQEPKNEKRTVGSIYLSQVETSLTNIPSLDWSGGGLVSTLRDLDIFIRALYSEQLIANETLDTMRQFNHSFIYGIDYGAGLMVFKLNKFVPFMKNLPQPEGHMGVLGTQMVYDVNTDTTYIASFGSTDYAKGSVKLMVQLFVSLNNLIP